MRGNTQKDREVNVGLFEDTLFLGLDRDLCEFPLDYKPRDRHRDHSGVE